MIDVERCAEVPVARPREDIDAVNARRVQAELSASVEDGSDKLVLDLSDTRYVDSAGIDMLLRLAERMRERRAQLVVVIPDDSSLSRLAEVVNLSDSVLVCDTVEGALDV